MVQAEQQMAHMQTQLEKVSALLAVAPRSHNQILMIIHDNVITMSS